MYSVIALIFGLVGGGLLAWALSLARRARASSSWPEAEGRIAAIGMSRFWLGRGTLYYPDIRYEYTVGDTELQGSRIGFLSTLPGFSHGAAIYALQRSYPRGRKVSVRYNPANPSDAVLEPGVRAGLRTVLGVAMLLIVLAVAASVVANMPE